MPASMGRPVMKIPSKRICAVAILLLAACTANEYATAATCQSLAMLRLPHAKVTQAQAITGRSFALAGSAAKFSDLPAFCRVAITSSPTSDSLIHIEVWIPLGKAWNGKFLQSGCGGFCGTVGYGALVSSVRRGYAGAVTDDGNQAPPGTATSDGSFALGHPEKVIDFGYRALKETTDDAKRVIVAFRRHQPARSYFMGCSDGGREALMEAQRFPNDFNGIIVGAPANNWTHMFAGMVANEQALLTKPASYVPISKLAMLSKAVFAQCRARDTGAPGDAFLTDPESCHFDPTAIQCSAGQNPDTCLTAPQVEAVKAIYDGPRDPRTGRVITPGFAATGNEDVTWPLWVVGASREVDINNSAAPPSLPLILTPAKAALQYFFGNQYFADLVYKNPKFDFRTFDVSAAVAKGEEGPGKAIDSTNPDLRAFEMHGGKMIQYHGWADPVLTPWTSVDYYKRVRAVMSEMSSGHTPGSFRDIQSFYRLFMVPGMAHCTGGPGPDVFGGYGNSPVIDAKHDILIALDRWVEQGVPPTEIVATHYVDDDPAKGVQFQRPLCPYPQVAHYEGGGKPSDASSFICR